MSSEHVEVLERLRGVLEHGKMGDKCLIAPDLVTAAIAALSAHPPAADEGFTAADMMDARQEGRKEAQQPAAVDGAWDELEIIVKGYLDDPHADAEYVLRKIAVLAAQQGGRSDDMD